jgi:16S rRNA (guanine527-N7)-methyltransferase
MFDFRESCARGLDMLELEVALESVNRLAVYFDELKKWSRKVNLVARSTTEVQLLEKHFLDSLALVPLLDTPGGHLLDIGSGAGFPGLVCKAACSGLEVTLVEPRLKRVNFLKHIIRTLQLDKVRVAATRIEDGPFEASGSAVTHITARAVSDISGFLKMAEPFAASGVQLLCMKGPRWEEELVLAEPVIERSAYGLARVENYFLPFCKAERFLLIFQQKNI